MKIPKIVISLFFLVIFFAHSESIELNKLLPIHLRFTTKLDPTSLAISPDGKSIAIGTRNGHLFLIDTDTETETEKGRWINNFSDRYIRHIIFDNLGDRFYVAEQSIDGSVSCVDRDGKILWSFRLADLLGTSHATNENDPYAWVQFPGASKIDFRDGDLFVSGVRSSRDNGISKTRSQFFCFDRDGKLKWKFPSEGPLPMIIRWFDLAENRIALLCDSLDESEKKSEFSDLSESVVVIENGDLRWSYRFGSLDRFYQSVTFWRGVAISPNGKSIAVTTDDGRSFIFSEDRKIWSAELTTPIEISGVPITATAGTVAATDRFVFFVTGDTFVPYHLQKGVQRPPTKHPNGLTFFVHSWEGEKIWRWQLQNMPQGIRISENGEMAIVAVSSYGETGKDLPSGVSIFDLKNGVPNYLKTDRISGRIPYDSIAISDDGKKIALIEVADEKGKVYLHIFQRQ